MTSSNFRPIITKGPLNIIGTVILNVIPFSSNKKHIVRLIRDAAVDTTNVVFPEDERMGEWQQITTDRQIIACLQKGDLVHGPITDSQGNQECTFKRFAAGVCIWVTVSLYKKENQWRLYISKTEKQT